MCSLADDPSMHDSPTRCRRHAWMVEQQTGHTYCHVCGHHRDEAAAARGRRAQRRGKRIQRQRITGLGGTNLAGSVPGLDGIGLAFRYESKSGAAFSEKTWRWLRGIPATAQQTRVLIVTSADGPGHPARSYVVVEYEAWRDLHGETDVA